MDFTSGSLSVGEAASNIVPKNVRGPASTSKGNREMDNHSKLFDEVMNVVVVVKSRPPEEEDTNPDEEKEYGAGVVINETGHILTCLHLIPDGYEVLVRFPGEEGFIDAKIVCRNENNDLAILKPRIKRAAPWRFCEFAGIDTAHTGMDVFAITHPQEMDFSCITGDVAHPTRELGELFGFNLPSYFDYSYTEKRFVQINNFHGVSEGSHGAAVFNSAGQVVGLISFVDCFDFALTVGPLKRFVDRFSRRQ